MSLLTVVAAAGAAPAGASAASAWQPIIMLVIFGLIFYFMLIRPQSKRAKEHKAMLEAVQKGDEVVTIGGIVGKVVKIKDQFVVVALNDNDQIIVQKHAVSATLPKGTIENVYSN